MRCEFATTDEDRDCFARVRDMRTTLHDTYMHFVPNDYLLDIAMVIVIVMRTNDVRCINVASRDKYKMTYEADIFINGRAWS